MLFVTLLPLLHHPFVVSRKLNCTTSPPRKHAPSFPLLLLLHTTFWALLVLGEGS